MSKCNKFLKCIINDIDSSWYNFLLQDNVMKELNSIEKKIGNDFYPDVNNVLRFLKVNLNDVKYIVLGMDPYPSDYEVNNKKIPIATGRSFEIGNYNSWNDSTKNVSMINIVKAIYKECRGSIKSIDEIREEINNGSFRLVSPNKIFDYLEKQGVLFLNCSFTVLPGKAKSHVSLWSNFSSLLQNYIINTNPDIIWILWGDEAINNMNGKIDSSKMITNCHPRRYEFVENSDFSKVKGIKVTI